LPVICFLACNLLSCLQQKWVVLKEGGGGGGGKLCSLGRKRKKKKEKGNMNQGHTNHFENRRG